MDCLPVGGGLRHPVPTMDRPVTVHLSHDPTSQEVTGQDKVGSGGRGRYSHALPEEVLVSPLYGMQDPTGWCSSYFSCGVNCRWSFSHRT